jgi:hypothetical protein
LLLVEETEHLTQARTRGAELLVRRSADRLFPWFSIGRLKKTMLEEKKIIDTHYGRH